MTDALINCAADQFGDLKLTFFVLVVLVIVKEGKRKEDQMSDT